MNLIDIELLGMTALILCLLMMPVAMKLAYIIGAIDEPDGRKVHQGVMPRTGGLSIGLSLLISGLLFAVVDRFTAAFAIGAAIILLTGLADDVWRIRPVVKFIGEILAALAFILISGLTLDSFGNLFGQGNIHSGSWAIPVTVFAIVGVINAMNLSDGLDGLASGLSLVACFFLTFLALSVGQWHCLALLMALAGSLLGFLYYNIHPARIFMGDSGSLLLGYSLATLAIMMVHPLNGDGASMKPITMALVLALPIMDTVLVMGHRLLLGKNPFHPDKTHLHHRLMDLGLPHQAVVPTMYVVMAVFGVLAVMLAGVPEWLQLAMGLFTISILYGTVYTAQRFGLRLKLVKVPAAAEAVNKNSRELLAIWLSRSVPWMTRLLPLLLLPPALAIGSFSDHWLLLMAMSMLVIFAMYPWRQSHEMLGIAHGLIYLATFLLLTFYQLHGSVWVGDYLLGISAGVGLWAVLKFIYHRHHHVLFASGFEWLMLVMTFVLPVIVVPQLVGVMDVGAAVQQKLVLACLESIPFVMAMKICIRRQPRRNLWLVGSLLSILGLLVVEGSVLI